MIRKTGEVSEDFFTGLLDKNYKANLNKKASGGGGGLFRSAKEKRGSKVALQKKVPPWDHKPQEGEIQVKGFFHFLMSYKEKRNNFAVLRDVGTLFVW